VSKDSAIRRLSWVICVGPKRKHMYSYERGKGRFDTDRKGVNVTTKAETGVMQPQTKGSGHPPASRSRRRQRTNSHRQPLKESSLCFTSLPVLDIVRHF